MTRISSKYGDRTKARRIDLQYLIPELERTLIALKKLELATQVVMAQKKNSVIKNIQTFKHELSELIDYRDERV
jgi:RNA processing factor Prp31